MFETAGTARLGVVVDDLVIDVGRDAPGCPADIDTLIEGGFGQGVAALRESVVRAPAGASTPITEVRCRLPISRPRKIICLGLNYADHAAEGGHARPAYPSVFLRATSSLIAHGDAIVRPDCSEHLDYEAELVAVIGLRTRHVAVKDALRCVAGYSCFNDATIRDYQRKTAQWTIGKNFDSTGAFGPVFVTADELPPGASGLRITSRLNGRVMQDANTRDMLFPVAETVALMSECMTLEPGDLIVMGTPAGVGHARKPPVWMKHGDVIEVEIEKIGLLRNRVADESTRPVSAIEAARTPY